MKQNSLKKHHIRLLIGTGLVIAIIFWWYSFNIFDFMFSDEELVLGSDFEQFALLVTIGYDMLPTIAQQFSISATTTQLLMTGFSPLVLAVISTIALLAGQMILYIAGIFIKKIHKGSIGNIAPHNHFLHQHYFLVYLAIPFVGVLGDAVMMYSGHQRINPVKLIPFLLVANFISSIRWIYSAVIQLGISEQFF